MNARTSVVHVLDLRDQRAKWDAVARAFYSHAYECEDCPHNSVTDEQRPYGEGYAVERLAACTLGSFQHHTPDQCPAIQENDDE